MGKILLKHLEGSKAGKVDSIDLPLTAEIVLGRDPSVQIVFDATKDDLVSRNHAHLRQEASSPVSISITDLGSRNGTYINGMRITGPAKLNPGDVISLGSGGPKIEFDLDPRPAVEPAATRLFTETNIAPPTRETAVFPHETTAMSRTPHGTSETLNAMPPLGETTTGQSGTNSIGRNTVERLISQTKSTNRKLTIAIAAVLVALVVIVAGAMHYFQKREGRLAEERRIADAERAKQDQEALAAKLKQVSEKGDTTASITNAGVDIAEKYIPATVFIEVSWKLIETDSGKQVYHAFKNREGLKSLFGVKQTPELPKEFKNKNPELPVYLFRNNTLEPALVLSDGKGASQPIGGKHTGSGFVVTDNGFILTNRHVAATWEDEYFEGDPPLPGYVQVCEDERCSRSHVEVLLDTDENRKYLTQLSHWVPSGAGGLQGKDAVGKRLEGRLDYLDVTFPKSTTPWRATLEKVSSNADVALIKIQTPHSVPSVQLCDGDCLKVGEMVTVMGYPGVSADAYAENPSYTPLHRKGSTRVIPDVTVTLGNVQKILKGEAETVGDTKVKYYSPYGDVFQLAINTTGAGNSGGPVFNDKGQVVGIFTYRKGGSNASVSLAVPIKFGSALMGAQKVIK